MQDGEDWHQLRLSSTGGVTWADPGIHFYNAGADLISVNQVHHLPNTTSTRGGHQPPPLNDARCLLAFHTVAKMASRTCITRCMRTTSSSMSSLSSSLRALSLRPTQQTRAISSTILPASPRIRSSFAAVAGRRNGAVIEPRVAAVVQQVRGMKVHSSIKKRCEHCKVR